MIKSKNILWRPRTTKGCFVKFFWYDQKEWNVILSFLQSQKLQTSNYWGIVDRHILQDLGIKMSTTHLLKWMNEVFAATLAISDIPTY